MNLKINAETRDQFRLVAELRGSTMSNLIHQFIVQSIWEEKKKHPEAFAALEIQPTAPSEEVEALESLDPEPKSGPESEAQSKQPPKKSPIRIVGVIPGQVFDDAPKNKSVAEEKSGKKK